MNTNIPWGGGEKWHLETANLLKSSHGVSLVCYEDSVIASKFNGHKKYLNVKKLSFLNPFKVFSLYKFFKKNNIKCVFLNLPQDMKLGSIAARLAGVEKIIYRRGMPHPIRASFFNKFFLKNFVTDIIANSEFVKKTVYQNIPELKEKTYVIFNVEKKDFSKKEYPKNLVIGSLGRLTAQKGYEHLIEVVKILKNSGVDFKVVIGGVGKEKRNIKEMISTYELEDYFEFLGLVDTKDFFQKISVLAFTSKFEGLSNVLVESLVYDTPCVAFDTTSNGEVIDQLIPAFNHEKFADKILKIHEDQALRADISKRSKVVLEEKFNYNTEIQKIRDLIQ